MNNNTFPKPKARKSNTRQNVKKIPYYHIDRSGDIHPFTIGMILSSLVWSLLATWVAAPSILSRFCLSPPWLVGENASYRTSFACGLLAPWVAASPTHNQGTSSPYGQQGRTRYPNWKGIDLDLILLSQRLRKPNRVITGKSKMAWCQNHIKLTGYIILKHIVYV